MSGCLAQTRSYYSERTALHRLEPIGIGTPFVESLSSYVARLANSHCVNVADLTTHVLYQFAPKEFPIISEYRRANQVGGGFGKVRQSMNGGGNEAQGWIVAVGAATGREDLHHLTLSRLKPIMGNTSPVRGYRAWCPLCFYEWEREGRPAYMPLAWSLRSVHVCIAHEIYLQDQCPKCGLQFTPLLAHTRPGLCSKCFQTLAAQAGNKAVRGAKPPVRCMGIAHVVGDLLAASPTLPVDTMLDNLRSNLRRIIDSIPGKTETVGLINGSSPSAIYYLCSGKLLLQGEKALGLVSALQLPIAKLLSGYPVEWNPSHELAVAIEKVIRKASRRRAIERTTEGKPVPRRAMMFNRLDKQTEYVRWIKELKRGMRRLLRKTPPLSLKEISVQLGCYVTSLKKHCPELCRKAKELQGQYRQSQLKKAHKQLLKALEKHPGLSLDKFFQSCPVSKPTFQKYFGDLYRRITLDRSRERAARSQERQEAACRLVPELVEEALQRGENPTYDRIRKKLGPGVSGNMKLIKGLIKKAQERWVLNHQFSGEKGKSTAVVHG